MMISGPRNTIGARGHSQGHLLVLSDPNCLGVIVNMEIVFIREIRNTFSKDGQEACSKSALTGPQSSRLSKRKKALTDDIQLESIILRIITGKEA